MRTKLAQKPLNWSKNQSNLEQTIN